MHFVAADIMTQEDCGGAANRLAEMFFSHLFSAVALDIYIPPIPMLDSFIAVLLTRIILLFSTSFFPSCPTYSIHPREKVEDLRGQETINLIMGSLPLFYFSPLSVHIPSVPVFIIY